MWHDKCGIVSSVKNFLLEHETSPATIIQNKYRCGIEDVSE